MAFDRYGTFTGGIDLPDEKHATQGLPTMPLALPATLRVPLAPDGRHAAIPIVQPGQRVAAGERIATADGGVDIFAPVAATVAGHCQVKVACWDRWESSPSLELKDLAGPWQPTPYSDVFDWQAATVDELYHRLLDGQIIMHRRRPEPLAHFLERARRKGIRTLIANVMENQPYVSADHRVLVEQGRSVLAALAMIGRVLDAHEIILAVDHRCTGLYADLQSSAERLHIKPVALSHKYPTGADPMLVKILTRREMPIGGSVMDVGSAVIDTATLLAIYRWVVGGQRCLGRVVTVAGERAGVQGNYYVPFGAACMDLPQATGAVIHGGPMVALPCDAQTVVSPATDAVLAIATPPFEAPAVCIRCGWCTDHCPARLNVSALNDAFELGQVELAQKLGVEASMECGVCSYVCPARLPLSQRVKQLKRLIESRRQAAGAEERP